jgi:hypothetical protein
MYRECFGFRRAWVRPGAAGSPVWSACGLPVPRFAVKVALPSGFSCRAVLAALPALPSLALVWCSALFCVCFKNVIFY